MNSNNNPDRINVSKKARRTIEQIDKEKFLNLDTSSTTRSSLFLFAMTFGVEGIPSKLPNTYQGGLMLEKSIDNKTKALMYAYCIANAFNKDNLDEVSNKEFIFNQSQELANTGFEIIEGYMTQKNNESLLWEMIDDLDEVYSKLSLDFRDDFDN